MNRILLVLLCWACAAAVSAQVPNYVPADGLVAWYPFDGNANDESGNNYDGIIDGAELTEDRFAHSLSALSFDGDWPNPAHVLLPDMPSPPSYTLSAWATKEAGDSDVRYIFSDFGGGSVGGIALLKNSSGIYSHTSGLGGDGACFSGENLVDDQWNHIVVIRNSESVSFWINGDLISTEACLTPDPIDRLGSAYIGRSISDGNPQPWQGLLDDIGIWNRALTEAEILGLYEAEAPCLDTSYTDITACDSVVWNGTTYSESGTYSYSGETSNNHSLSFDGVDDYVNLSNCSDEFVFDIGFNISFLARTSIDLDSESFIYFRNNSLPNSPIIYIRHSQYDQNDDEIYVRGTSGEVYEAISIPEQTWFHFSLNLDRSTGVDIVQCYIDGVEILETSNAELGVLDFTDCSIINETGLETGVYLGTAPQVNWDYFTGQMDNVQIWAKSNSEEEIQSYMNCPPTGDEAGLVGYWNFEEGPGSTVALDQTSNGNNGTINGATYDANTPAQSCQLTNANGCDSTAVLNLTINHSDISYTDITACDSVVWNGTTYSESGTHSYSGETSNNYSLSFDGVDDKVFISQTINLDSYTLNSWTYLNGTELDYKPILWIGDTNSSALEIYGQFDGNFNSNLNHTISVVHNRNNSNPFGAAQFTPLNNYFNQWLFLSVTYESGNISVYFNGVEQLSLLTDGDISNPYITPNDFPVLGYLNWSGNEQFLDGYLNNVSLWNTALSQTEIQNYMNCPPTGDEAGLVGYWNFEEGQGTTALDLSGNGNNGTINGATYDANTPAQSCQLTNANGCDSTAVLNLTLASCDFVSTFCGEGTVWDDISQSCIVANPTDVNLDGCTGISDLLDVLANFGVCSAGAFACGDPKSHQGYDYATVQIGEQCWFAENLRADLYENGDSIPMIFENEEWLATSDGALCWHNNDSSSFGFPGFLYNGFAVSDVRSVCPQSWHVATDEEWMELEISHGLSLEEAQTTGNQRGAGIELSQKMRDDSWGYNELGFGAQRGGYRQFQNGEFSSVESGAFWSYSDTSPGFREFYTLWSGVARGEIGISNGMSVRCLKD